MKTYRQQCFRYIQCFTRCESGIDFFQLCLLCVGLLDIDSPRRPSRHFLKWRPFDKTVSRFFNKAMCQKQPQQDSIMSFNELRGLNARMMLQSNQDKTMILILKHIFTKGFPFFFLITETFNYSPFPGTQNLSSHQFQKFKNSCVINSPKILSKVTRSN